MTPEMNSSGIGISRARRGDPFDELDFLGYRCVAVEKMPASLPRLPGKIVRFDRSRRHLD
jgi:hypothetical protein